MPLEMKTKEEIEKELKFHTERYHKTVKHYNASTNIEIINFHFGNMNALKWVLGMHDA